MIGEKIKNLADNAKKTREQMAVMLGISVPTLHRIYKSDNVDTNILKIVANNFDIPVSYFFEDIKNIDTHIQNNLPSKTEKPDNAIIEELRSTIEKANHYIERLERSEAFLQDLVKNSFQTLSNQIADLKKHNGVENVRGERALNC